MGRLSPLYSLLQHAVSFRVGAEVDKPTLLALFPDHQLTLRIEPFHHHRTSSATALGQLMDNTAAAAQPCLPWLALVTPDG